MAKVLASGGNERREMDLELQGELEALRSRHDELQWQVEQLQRAVERIAEQTSDLTNLLDRANRIRSGLV